MDSDNIECIDYRTVVVSARRPQQRFHHMDDLAEVGSPKSFFALPFWRLTRFFDGVIHHRIDAILQWRHYAAAIGI